MKELFIFDPTVKDTVTRDRGGGRIVQILKENLSNCAEFITNFEKVTKNDLLLVPVFNPLQKPILSKKIAQKQIIMIFDAIPLKYPSHFPVGIRGKINLFLNKKALAHFDTIITISRHSKQDITDYFNIPPEKITVIYPTASNVFLNTKSEGRNQKQNSLESLNLENSDLFRASDFGFRASSYCIYVGDVNWNKNLVNLAKAIKIANVDCVFVGKMFQKNFRLLTLDSQLFSHPWQKEFKDFLKEIADDPHFIFAGYKTDKELIKLYQQACLNILISRDEGFGFSYIEASTLGCPSILSDIPIFHETAKKTALFANPDNPKYIARKIKQIFDDNALHAELSFKAQERAKYFSAEKFQKQLMSLF